LNRIYAIVVHSFAETVIYQDYYALDSPMLVFIPFVADPRLLSRHSSDEGPVLAVGGYRDFPTFLRAVEQTSVPSAVIAHKGVLPQKELPENVVLHEDISREAYLELISHARCVVIPLKNRARSVGQVVLTDAMALGKAVIATRTIGTVDYIESGKTGILVPPSDAQSLREAILLVARDREAGRRLGLAARESARLSHEIHLKALHLVIESALEARRTRLDPLFGGPPVSRLNCESDSSGLGRE
jgi:glycosyltransferase involved in cell wall biosynthesis